MTNEPSKLCALCSLPRDRKGSRLIEINGYKRWVHVRCATNSKEPKQ